MIISHGHYDHSGGFKKLINLLNKYSKLVVGEEFFKAKYKMTDKQTYKYNGNSFDEKYILEHNIPLKKVKEGIFYITDNIMVFHHFLRKNDIEKRNEKFYIIEKNLSSHDNVNDEVE